MNTHVKPRATYCLRVRTILSNETGAAAIEYAVVVGVVLVGAIACSHIVGQGIMGTTNEVSVYLAGAPAHAANAAATDLVVPSVVEPSKLQWLSRLAMVLAYGMAMFAVAFLWRLRKQPKKVSRPVEERDPNQFAHNRKRIQAVLRTIRNELATSPVRVEHVMDRQVATVGTKAKRAEISSRLKSSAMGVVFVLNETGALVGSIEQAQLDASPETDVLKLMTEVVDQVDSKAYLSSVIELMQRRRLRWVPILSSGALCGVLSIDEVMATLLCTLQLISEIDQEYRVVMRRAMGLHEAEA